MEKYDGYIKNLHITVLQYIESLWSQTYDLLVDNWHKFLAGLEPTFLKFAHYVETLAWTTGREVLGEIWNYFDKLIIIRGRVFASHFCILCSTLLCKAVKLSICEFYILHFICYILHFTFYMLHFKFYFLYITFCI